MYSPRYILSSGWYKRMTMLSGLIIASRRIEDFLSKVAPDIAEPDTGALQPIVEAGYVIAERPCAACESVAQSPSVRLLSAPANFPSSHKSQPWQSRSPERTSV
jgi:hypothetical protein